MRRIIASLALAALLATTAGAEGTETTKPACLRVNSINGWAHGNEQIARLDTAGRRWRVTFRRPCLNNRDKPLGLRFGIRVGTTCVTRGDELVFVTIGGFEQFCIVEKVELLKFGEMLVPPVPAPAQ